MRRPLAALVLGAVSLAGLVPAAGAAGAAELPKFPFFHRKPVLKLGCKVVREEAPPAVACRWSSPRPATADPTGITFELRRGGGGAGRTVVYTGPERFFVDTSVEPGGHYAYRAEVVRPEARRMIHSRVVVVRVPKADDRDPMDPVPVPNPKPRPADPRVKPTPAPEPKPAPAPKPAPDPKPRPAPEPKPKPVPEPTPAPLPMPGAKPTPEPTPRPAAEPAPKRAPTMARMKLTCTLQRMATTDTGDSTTNSTTIAPTRPAVVCEWAAPADLKMAGYQLWRAERPDGTKQVVFRSADATRYVDRAVSSGHSYVYVVRALDANGRVIGQSDAVTVTFPPTMTTNTGARA